MATLNGSKNGLRRHREQRSNIITMNHNDFRRSIQSEKRVRRKRISIVENRRHPTYNGICIYNGFQSFCPINIAFSTTPIYHQNGSRRYLSIKILFKTLKHSTYYHDYNKGYNGFKYHFGYLENIV